MEMVIVVTGRWCSKSHGRVNPRRNALLKEGSKNDKVDARKLADLLRTRMLRPAYHGEHGLRTLRELARMYQIISQDPVAR